MLLVLLGPPGRRVLITSEPGGVSRSAAALARHLRQGRDRRLAVLDWFAETDAPLLPGVAVVPEPPAGAVREALVWVLERSGPRGLCASRATRREPVSRARTSCMRWLVRCSLSGRIADRCTLRR